MKVASLDQSATLRISDTETPSFYAAEVEAERVEWDPNIEVSIPESLSTVLIHLANVIDEIGLCGDTTDKNSGSGVDGLCLGRYSAVYSL